MNFVKLCCVALLFVSCASSTHNTPTETSVESENLERTDALSTQRRSAKRTPAPPIQNPLWTEALQKAEDHDVMMFTRNGEPNFARMKSILAEKVSAMQRATATLIKLRTQHENNAPVYAATMTLEARMLVNFSCTLLSSSIPSDFSPEQRQAYTDALNDQSVALLEKAQKLSQKVSSLPSKEAWQDLAVYLNRELSQRTEPLDTASTTALCARTEHVWMSPKLTADSTMLDVMRETCTSTGEETPCKALGNVLRADEATLSEAVEIFGRGCTQDRTWGCRAHGEALLEEANSIEPGKERLGLFQQGRASLAKTCPKGELCAPQDFLPIPEEMKIYTERCVKQNDALSCMKRSALLASQDPKESLVRDCAPNASWKEPKENKQMALCSSGDARACLLVGLRGYPALRVQANMRGKLFGMGFRGVPEKTPYNGDRLDEKKAQCLDNDDAKACMDVHVHGESSGVKRDPWTWIRRACDLDPDTYCVRYAKSVLGSTSVIVDDRDRAYTILSTRCGRSSGTRECLDLARFFSSYDSALGKDAMCAAAYFWTACNIENVEQCSEAASVLFGRAKK